VPWLRGIEEVDMDTLKKFHRKKDATVVAVRLDLDTDGFTYQKWGGTQRCKAGDWIVTNNAGDTYTIDADTFAKTYRMKSTGIYKKDTSVWAKRAETAGVVPTKEGSTAYQAGYMLVYNDAEGKDGYAMSMEEFESLYEPADS